jgi:hypothetical protein
VSKTMSVLVRAQAEEVGDEDIPGGTPTRD